MARERVERVRERAMYSSWFAPAMGAGVGALVARALQSRAQSRDEHRYDGRFRDAEYGRQFRGAYGRSGFRGEESPYGTYEEGTLPAEGFQEMKERAGSKVEEFKGRAGDVKERVEGKAGELKERMSEQVHSLRERLPDRAQLRASAHEDTGVWALGAAALGFLFGFALPATQQEQRLLEPAKRKARELGEQAKEMAVQKGSEALDKASERIGSVQQEAQREQHGGGFDTPPAVH